MRESPKTRVLGFLWTVFRGNGVYVLLAVILTLVNRCASLVLPLSLKWLLDGFTTVRGFASAQKLLWIVAGGVVLQAVSAYLLNHLVITRSHAIAADIRERTLSRVLRSPLSFFEDRVSGELAARICVDTDALRHAFGFPMIDFAGGIAVTVAAATALFRMNIAVSALILALLVSSIVGFALCVVISKDNLRERARLLAEGSGRMSEFLSAVPVIRAFAAEAYVEREHRDYLHRLTANVSRTTSLSSLISAGRVVVAGGTGLLVLWVGLREIALGRLTAGGLATAIALAAMMGAALLDAGTAAITISESFAGAERLSELFEVEIDSRSGLPCPGIASGRLTFDAVSFSYKADRPVLDCASLELLPNSVTAVVGASGTGKSTIAKLALGLHLPSSGRILIDGYDLLSIDLASFHAHVGYVPQEVLLVSGTIRENILFGRSDISRDSFAHACRLALVDEFADLLPLGYDTPVGERGARISGGQAQRIAIARALLLDPKLLVLDEPTATLDGASAEYVHQAIRAGANGRTTLVITHSPALIRLATTVFTVRDRQISPSSSTETHLREAELTEWIASAHAG